MPKHASYVIVERPYDRSLFSLAWISGLVYIAIGSLEGLADYHRIAQDEWLFGVTGYRLIKLTALVSYLLFMAGYVRLGIRYDNSLLKVAAIFCILVTTLFICYDLVLIDHEVFERSMILVASAISSGLMSVVLGIAIKNLSRPVGDLATIAALIEIVAGACLITVILALPGLILLFAAQIVEVIILYRVAQQVNPRLTI